MTKQQAFNDAVSHFFQGDERENALSSLRAYLHPGAFTGAWFERIPHTDPYAITAEDIVAVSMLSVDIPPRLSAWLLGDGAPLVRSLLEEIPVDERIGDSDSLLLENGPAWKLWNQLRNFSDVGRTKTSKLMARKRPRLIPIYDSVVGKALGIENSKNTWELWNGFMRDFGISDFREDAHNAGASHLSDLRIIDIVIWMRCHGATFISKAAVHEPHSMIPVCYLDPS
jgi:hypothetical protein